MEKIEQIYKSNNLIIQKVETSPYGTNAYILTCKKTSESLLVDAPGEASIILKALERSLPKLVVITHDHFDHIGALLELKTKLNIPVAANPLDSSRLPVKIDRSLKEGDSIGIGEVKLKVLHTPGHTPGSICLQTENVLFSGDTLFPHGPGRTNTPKNFKTILDSLKVKIFTLPDDFLILPGHGDSTLLGREKDEFAVFSSSPHQSRLCGNVLWLSS